MEIRVLVVDDEQEIADLVALYLRNEGYAVDIFTDGDAARRQIESAASYDLAILDVMLPGTDGFSLCRIIREKYFYPVLMLTAKSEGMDKISGLTIGADDYITKPFNPLELVARVKTQLRRYTKYNTQNTPSATPDQEHDIRGLIINHAAHKCTLYGKPINLTPTEFSVLWYLCDNRGRAISSEELFEQVWKELYLDNNNTVMAHIGRLREKLGDSSRHPKFIKTIWGVGYQIE